MPRSCSVSFSRLVPICFSPDTSRLPLGITSITVTAMVPVKTLDDSVWPLPSILFEDEASIEVPAMPRVVSGICFRPGTPLMNGMLTVGTSTPMLPVRLVLVADFCEALIFSAITTVSTSPTWRGPTWRR